MPRQFPVQFPGALYHVMARGDRREAIFRNDDGRRMFLAALGQAGGRTGWLCHAYVLMVQSVCPEWRSLKRGHRPFLPGVREIDRKVPEVPFSKQPALQVRPSWLNGWGGQSRDDYPAIIGLN